MKPDIEKLRDDVINAARKDREKYGSRASVVAALDALDAAMKPDPWALLDEYQNGECSLGEWQGEMLAALAWRRENPDA